MKIAMKVYAGGLKQILNFIRPFLFTAKWGKKEERMAYAIMVRLPRNETKKVEDKDEGDLDLTQLRDDNVTIYCRKTRSKKFHIPLHLANLLRIDYAEFGEEENSDDSSDSDDDILKITPHGGRF